ncbi:hypothetical protein G6F57_005744 [Rhizopus arrhizus]|uniref:m7GpppX diphosphatase n=1 Tax=Rhizopus oryzae TaxID=64495 RepID=A0A9P6XCE7_RHIOR|nr:hypothetical protein G6F30_001972 [Rhizopus arrhizus]KAG1415716.1 hypothetical protein G6F58_006348 [Rhizopus delemar]KAG0985358.1 hypothetical protein G6F29_004077 [Rhizopus arrhizus]KAG0996812.1 hypothetical protein G6F28_003489 [Rhizopus arrhizus]KAG1007369.1 hypothetical protein G6F27_007444 [Rhizopus arrhizus]
MTSITRVLNNFQFERVLSNDVRTKLVHLLGHVDDQKCILTFEKIQFENEEMPQLPNFVTSVDSVVENNIYSWALGQVEKSQMRVKVICPATDVHIAKYEAQTRLMIRETPADYERYTLPYIQSIPASRTQWVQNILDGSSEADRVIYRDNDPETGFVVLPDMKWDGSQENLYWVAIAMRSDISSLRSLRGEHLGLLRKLRDKSYELVKEKTNLSPEQVRLFVHYQPSYYHFHLHITAVTFVDAPGIVSGQAHLLTSIIDHLEHFPNYYQLATIPFLIATKLNRKVQVEEDGEEEDEEDEELQRWSERCSICFDAKLDLCLDLCRDQFCLSCFQRYVSEVVKSSWGLCVTKIRCPVCRLHIPQTEWTRYVPKSISDLYDKFNQPYRSYSRCCPQCEVEVIPCAFEPERYYPSRSRVIGSALKEIFKNDDPFIKLFERSEWRNSTLVECGYEAHINRTCEENMNYLIYSNKDHDLIQTLTWALENSQRCPSCSIMINRDEGCNKVDCTFCGFTFCWECKSVWSNRCGFFDCVNVQNPRTADRFQRQTVDRTELGVPDISMIESRLFLN